MSQMGELGACPKNSPVAVAIQRAVVSNGFGGESVTVNRDGEFPAKNFQTGNVVAMFMGQENAVQLFRSQSALFQPQH